MEMFFFYTSRVCFVKIYAGARIFFLIFVMEKLHFYGCACICARSVEFVRVLMRNVGFFFFC